MVPLSVSAYKCKPFWVNHSVLKFKFDLTGNRGRAREVFSMQEAHEVMTSSCGVRKSLFSIKS